MHRHNVFYFVILHVKLNQFQACEDCVWCGPSVREIECKNMCSDFFSYQIYADRKPLYRTLKICLPHFWGSRQHVAVVLNNHMERPAIFSSVWCCRYRGYVEALALTFEIAQITTDHTIFTLNHNLFCTFTPLKTKEERQTLSSYFYIQNLSYFTG